MYYQKKKFQWSRVLAAFTLTLFMALSLIMPPLVSAAPTTSLTIKKVAADGTTVLAQKTVDYHWLMNPGNIPVLGDGGTHYYHQGPVFKDGPDEAAEQALRWNPEEDTNIETKDMGALKGNNVKDLCELVGGMKSGDTLRIKAADGFSRTFAYKNVYQYSPREGPMVICWFRDGQYPDSGFREGMRLVWFADASTNPWGWNVLGNWDWHQAAESKYWYYFQSGAEKYPTTTGLSIQTVSELIINSTQPAPKGQVQPVPAFKADVTSGPAPLTVNFSDQSANGPTTWAWDFNNDGTTDSSKANPSYTYSDPGTYSIRLTVSNAAGQASEVKADLVSVLQSDSTSERSANSAQESSQTPADDIGRSAPVETSDPQPEAGQLNLVIYTVGLLALLALGFAVYSKARAKKDQ